MKARCLNPNTYNFKEYAGRGITICERWLTFTNFLADMNEVPDGLTLERIDNDKGYYLENCEWATRTKQARNRRSSRLETINGVTKSFAQWAEDCGINYWKAHQRLNKRGWTVEEALGIVYRKPKTRAA